MAQYKHHPDNKSASLDWQWFCNSTATVTNMYKYKYKCSLPQCFCTTAHAGHFVPLTATSALLSWTEETIHDRLQSHLNVGHLDIVVLRVRRVFVFVKYPRQVIVVFILILVNNFKVNSLGAHIGKLIVEANLVISEFLKT